MEPSIPANENINRPKGISRRTLVKGAAWSVPAVTVLGATPAFAASPGEITLPDTSESACKYTGNYPSGQAYRVELCFTNNMSDQRTITITGAEFKGTAISADNYYFWYAGSFSETMELTLEGGETGCFYIFWTGKNLAQGDLRVTYTMTPGYGVEYYATTDVQFDPSTATGNEYCLVAPVPVVPTP